MHGAHTQKKLRAKEIENIFVIFLDKPWSEWHDVPRYSA
jgi:hypothetical protein